MRRWLVIFVGLAALPAFAQAPEPRERQEQAIEPGLDRPAVVVPRVEAGNVEVNLYGGTLTMEGFTTRFVYGLRGNYHITEDLFVEASLGFSDIDDRTYRELGAPPFDQRTEDVEYYDLTLAYNLLPGESFLGTGRAYTSAAYLVAGAGNTRIVSEDYFTYLLGFGIRVLPTQRLSLRLDYRHRLIRHDLLGRRHRTQNPEVTFGIGIYF